MDKAGAEVIMLVLLPVLLLQWSPLVSAVDLMFYTDTTQTCAGSGLTCQGIAATVCCSGSGSSVGIANADNSVFSRVSASVGCDSPAAAQIGQICYTGFQFTGATWSNIARRRLLVGEFASTPCETQMKPNGVFFTDDGMKGHWILTTSDTDELHSQMLSLPDAEKVIWLISQGATYNEL